MTPDSQLMTFNWILTGHDFLKPIMTFEPTTLLQRYSINLWRQCYVWLNPRALRFNWCQSFNWLDFKWISLSICGVSTIEPQQLYLWTKINHPFSEKVWTIQTVKQCSRMNPWCLKTISASSNLTGLPLSVFHPGAIVNISYVWPSNRCLIVWVI